ncbi:MAG: efflux RND transporter periplasmic adaptor subunit [Candidatus Azobacteroides sp.]|nr:efflux RND transporter periplasmic adaptor subunit [Candidatus Azobacteroides sp.]
MKKIIGVLIITGLSIAACRSHKQQDNEADFVMKGNTVIVNANGTINSKIELQTVVLQPYSADLKTTGTVEAISGQMAEIAPPFSGRITKSFVKLGQKVSKGTPLFELSSTEFYEATKEYFQAFQNKNTTEINYKRQKDLVANGVGSQKDLEEAESTCENARKDYENKAANLNIFGVNPANITMGQPLTVFSPIAGEVVRSNMVIGQYLKEDAGPALIVADLNKVWVVALVKEKYIRSIKENDTVEVYTDATPGTMIPGKIYHIEEMLDEATRSVRVLIECNNSDRLLKPGMFAGVHFRDTSQESVIIPDTAIFQFDQGNTVFVQTAKNEYRKQKIESQSIGGGLSLVTAGLTAGETIVVQGGIYLISR